VKLIKIIIKAQSLHNSSLEDLDLRQDKTIKADNLKTKIL